MIAKWYTPAVTPFQKDGSIDFESAGTLYEHLIEAGMDGILIGGSIGEFFAQPIDQRLALVRFAAEKAAGRVKIIAGTASMVAGEIVTLSNACLEAGADAVMIVPPYYFSFGDGELYSFYAEMARSIHGPVYIYNFPDRTGYSISPAVIKRLAEDFSNIVGVKDTISGIDHTREIIKAVKPVRPEFEVFSGFDDNFAHNVLCGGDGCIGGMSNVAPAMLADWVKAMRADDLKTVAAYQKKVDRCMGLYSIGAPFVPYVKEAARQAGHIACSKPTFPMPELNEEEIEKVTAFLKHAELI